MIIFYTTALSFVPFLTNSFLRFLGNHTMQADGLQNSRNISTALAISAMQIVSLRRDFVTLKKRPLPFRGVVIRRDF